MGRNLGAISPATIQANAIDHSYFVRADVAAPVGTKRWTDRWVDFTGNIDGGSQTWTSGDFILGPLNQSSHASTAVSSVSFANLFDQNLAPWTGWAISPGLRGVKAQIWDAWFSLSTGALIDKVKLFEGTIDGGEFGDRANLELAPYIKPWSRQIPSITGMVLGAAPLMPDVNTTIHWGDLVGMIVGYKPPNTSGVSNGAPKPYDMFGGIFDSSYSGSGRVPGKR